MLDAMRRGTKFLIAAGFGGIAIVACAIAVPLTDTADASGKISHMVQDYRGGMPGPDGNADLDTRLFVQAFQRVRKAYVRPTEDVDLFAAANAGMRETYPDPSVASNSELVAAAVNGMMESLDDYSVYLDPDEFTKLNQEINGSFGGLGIEIKKDPLGLEVISPIDGTPAMRAGILPGDRLTHADGNPLADLTLRESVELLRGEAGTSVTVTVARTGKAEFDVPLTREIIRIERVKARIEDGVAYLRITHFVRDTGNALRQKMAELKAEAAPDGGLKGFIVDLRSNPGGLLDESVAVSGAFLSGGVVVSTRSRTDEQEFDADAPDPSEGLPVVVMINQGSASASEIVAGALKDRKRAVIVGERSYGKGSVQTTYRFHGAGGLKLTTALYYTPSGKTVEGGIEPNTDAVDDPETEDVDEALVVAIDLMREMVGGHSVLWSAGTVKN